MKKNLLKVTTILLIVLAMVFTFCTPAFAAGFEETIEATKDTSGATEGVLYIINSILFIAQVIGMGVATIMLIVLAIKYIAASPNDKAEIKKHLVVYVVGALILFTASGLLGIVRKYALGLNKQINKFFTIIKIFK